MALSDRAAAILARIEATPDPDEWGWETPEDVSRLSVERMMARSAGPVRTLHSRGSIRLAGEGVSGNSAPLDAVGDVMARFQRLVTTVGAAHAGDTSARGKPSRQIVARTRLRLLAGPAPGSVVLNLTPDTAPDDELAPAGSVALFDQPTTQTVDRAVEEVVAILRAAADAGPDADESSLVGDVERLGPRVASTLRIFAKTLDSSGFDAGLEWDEPFKPTFRASVRAADAGRLAGVIEGRELDRADVVIVGVLRTVSDKTTPMEVEAAGSSFKIKGVPADAIHQTRPSPGDTVRVVARVSVRDGLDGERSEYSATNIEVVGPGTPQSVTESP
ncbi:MAG: hypothetical protein LBK42_11905 [Propionibacteriaceae bacterium]|jgi:hypothetical protein|nr:hypothetical protein [Propionibacteriaceae bacterium]